MKILLGTDTYPPDVNGAARFTERLGVGLAARGHEVHTLAPSPVGRSFTENRDGVIVHRVRSHRYPLVENFQICMPWEASPYIRETLREVAPDVVHAQAHFLVGRYLIKAAHESSVPLVATNHFMPENLVDHVKITAFMQRMVSDAAWRDLAKVFRRADVVTAPTPRAVELLATSAAKLDGGRPISCGIDSEKYAAAAQGTHSGDMPVVLFVGRLDQEKRVNELIDAVAELPRDLPFRVEIVGDGSMREEWQRQATDLGVDDRISFLGFVSEEDLLAAYGRCDIFVMPGIAELQSLVTLEAMSAGKPVICADAMALPHLCHPGKNGYLFQPGDARELAAHLQALLTNPSVREQMGEASKEIVEGHAIGATLDTFEALYREVIASHQA